MTEQTLMLTTTELGDIIADGEGKTVYLFKADGQGDSQCYDDCEQKWPVVGATSVGDGLDPSLLGSHTRKDGSAQATYNGWPLYLFVKDAHAGDTNGQGMKEVWYVLDAQGNAIEA